MVVVMYVRRSSTTPQVLKEIQEATDLFSDIDEELEEIDVTNNPSLQSQIQKETACTEFPIFYENHLTPIGPLVKLKQWVENYKWMIAEELSEQEKSFQILEEDVVDTPKNEKAVSAGVVGGTLDTLEWIMRGSSSLLSPSSWFGWNSTNLPEQTESHEFPVVRTNWYYRQQKRILRFTDNGIERVHPITKSIQSFHPYSSLVSVEIVNSVFIKFTFNEELLQTCHEYYEISPSCTVNLINILQSKVPTIPITHETVKR